MQKLIMKKAKLMAEITNVQKQAKILAVQKNRGAHYERLERQADERIEMLKNEISQLETQIAAARK